jgi:hypothetical protein
MSELGRVLPHIIHALATTPDDDTPVLFAKKLDIKDGSWWMVVPEEEEYNFAYVLPQPPGSANSEPMIVIWSSLQMG